jgi:hypothetical protein
LGFLFVRNYNGFGWFLYLLWRHNVLNGRRHIGFHIECRHQSLALLALLVLRLLLVQWKPTCSISSLGDRPLRHARTLLSVFLHNVLCGGVVDSKRLRSLFDSGLRSPHNMNEGLSLLILNLHIRSLSFETFLGSILTTLRLRGLKGFFV